MQGYVLLVTPQQEQALSEQGVFAAPLTVDGQQGLAVPDSQIDTVLDILNARVRKKEKSREFEGVYLVSLKTRDPDAVEAETVIASWDGDDQEAFVDSTQEFLGELLHNQGFEEIQIHVPHKNAHQPIDDGNFHIFVWSAPVKNKREKPPKKIWGIPVSCRDEAYLPSPQSVVFYDDESDYAVGELVQGNNLYIFHDICHHGSSDEVALYRALLTRVSEYLLLDDKGREDYGAERELKRREASAQEYIRYCTGRIDKEVERLESEAEGTRAKLSEYQQKLTEVMAQARDAETLLGKLRERQENQEETLRREFDLLFDTPEIIDLRVFKDKVVVFTDTLYCVDDRNGQEHEIGKFRIELFFGVNDCVRWFNLTRLVKAGEALYNAPHVSENGAGCLGNMGDKNDASRGVYPTLLRELKLHQAVLMAIKFPQSVNTGDRWGKHISLWPKSTRKEES